MNLVVDASIALSWQFDDETNDYAERVLDAVMAFGASVPFHWKAEVANALMMGIRRRRITIEDKNQIISDLENLKLEHDADGLQKIWTITCQLAEAHGLTVYDAIYLELALRLGLRVATLDTKLFAAAKALGIEWAESK